MSAQKGPMDCCYEKSGVRLHTPLRAVRSLVNRQRQLLVEGGRRFVAERVRLSKRLENALKSYFSQTLQLVGEWLTKPVASAFLEKWPTWQAVQ